MRKAETENGSGMDCIRNQFWQELEPGGIKESTSTIEYQMTKKALRRNSAASVINWKLHNVPINCTFTVRWSDEEKQTAHAKTYATR